MEFSVFVMSNYFSIHFSHLFTFNALRSMGKLTVVDNFFYLEICFLILYKRHSFHIGVDCVVDFLVIYESLFLPNFYAITLKLGENLVIFVNLIMNLSLSVIY